MLIGYKCSKNTTRIYISQQAAIIKAKIQRKIKVINAKIPAVVTKDSIDVIRSCYCSSLRSRFITKTVDAKKRTRIFSQ